MSVSLPVRKVPFHQVSIGRAEMDAVQEAMESNWLSPRGPKVPELGRAWADVVGHKHGIATSSGTGAIHVALLASGVGPGDTVIVPTYTCSPTVYPVSYVGATPVFVDCELETYGMDPAKLEDALWRTKPKAIIVVDLYGSSCHEDTWEVLDAYRRRHELIVIEDACESVGGRYHAARLQEPEIPMTGARADIGTFSLRGDKILTALGTGGIVTTNDDHLARMIAYYVDLGLHNDSTMGRYRDLACVGMNYEISNPAAACGIVQIERREEIVAGRRESAASWRDALAAAGATPETVVWMDDYPGHAYYQFPLLFPRLRGADDLDVVGERIQARSVPLIPPFWPMHLQPAYKAKWDGPRKRAALANAEYASGHVLLFPCYPDLSEDDIAYMAAVITEEEQWTATQQS